MPAPIEPHPSVAPIKLNTVCNESFDNEYVTVAGRGLKSHDDRGYLKDDQRIRQTQLEILPYDECVKKTEKYPIGTVICALPKNDRSVGFGDSGIFKMCGSDGLTGA